MTQTTVGLDFGTHQTKVCVEKKDGAELEYKFFLFKDKHGVMQYTIPSVIQLSPDGRLSYGYMVDNRRKKNIKYFKQSAFQTTRQAQYTEQDGKLYSIWYLANILFDLEEVYGQDFAIQMGVPSDSSHLDRAKRTAVSIIVSAYKLVEDVFGNDKQRFLDTTIEKLRSLTKIVPYSKKIKDEYGILVFPEAYACLKPLIKRGKIATGMSLMVDIGGGTTDMSFFTIENDKPQVYDFYSLGKGLNFLTGADSLNGGSTNTIVKSASEIDKNRRNIYLNEVNHICNNLVEHLKSEYNKQTRLHLFRLIDALKTRPIVYCGGGSTFNALRIPYGGFRVRQQITPEVWNTKAVSQIDDIKVKGLCPILSTAYGLSISVADDNIERLPFEEVFKSLRGATEFHQTSSRKLGSAISSDGFDYGTDYDALK